MNINMNILNEIYSLWFQNSQWWFNADQSVDTLLETKFYIWINHIHLQIPMNKNTKDADNSDYFNNLSKDEIIGLVILFDQIPRHTYRNSYGKHIIEYYLQYALQVSLYIRNNTTLYNSLNVYEWSFVNLPFRHSNNILTIHKVMKDAWTKIEAENDDISLSHVRKFIRATYERYPFKLHSNLNILLNKFIPKISNESLQISKYKDLLAYAPDTNPLDSFDIHNSSFEIIKSCKNTVQLCKNKTDQPAHCIVSLSGGVDSMICSYIFAKLTSINIYAVHIDYWNLTRMFRGRGIFD
jgi:uncharacterized protein (DUF924 family)